MKQKPPTKRKSRGLLSSVVVTLALLIGLCLLLYPTVADYINSLDYKKDIQTYRTQLQTLDDSARRQMLAEATAFNQELLRRSTTIGELSADQKREYDRLLDPTGTGMMGYVAIEKAGVYLPVYHGTAEDTLQAGVGHIAGSSLPVGGVGTHAILSGHTGLPSTKLFSNIDQLQLGDTFELHIVDEVLTYRVESIVTLLPEEAERQSIDPARDMVTLMTCTPYGINTHRLLVRGVRTETPPDRAPGSAAEAEIPVTFPLALLAAAVALLLAARRKKRRKEARHEPEQPG